MGNGSSSKYGGLVIQTDQAYCVSGQPVTGKIGVQINEPFPAKKLKIKVKGKEKCKWYERKSRQVQDGDEVRIEYYEDKHDEDHKIFKFEETLCEFDGDYIEPGQYMFPFNFVLPSNCPASAYYTGDEKSVGYIKYKVKASFKAEDDTPVKDIKGKCHLVVRQLAPGSHFNIRAREEVDIKKCCCCWSKGICKLECCFERNVYHSQETAKAIVNVDNSDCDADVDNVVMNLKQTVTLRTDHHTYQRTFKVLERFFKGVDDEEKLENKEIEINLAESKQPFKHHDHDDIKPLDQSESILAEYLQPTTNGKCVNIQYQLEVKCKMDDVCCIYDEPNCIIDMFLQPPWIPNFAPVQPPEGWDPQIYDTHQMSLPYQIANPGITDVHPEYAQMPQPQSQPMPPNDPQMQPYYGGAPDDHYPAPDPSTAHNQAPHYGPGMDGLMKHKEESSSGEVDSHIGSHPDAKRGEADANDIHLQMG
ncbi:unnamed protein product [Moneuplotes crassus]|uniref:Arrestin-like N-terminal domain-containing protein n=1 Tax=Euplotes crassus TaxID=5936 RepID=A0AAD1XD42_EUPCR|nr:unnamed protein product [Moneuplotes crassus]